MTRRVKVRAVDGWAMSLHPAGPKWSLKCGNCPATFQARIPRIDHPTIQCPSCGAWNDLPVTWEDR